MELTLDIRILPWTNGELTKDKVDFMKENCDLKHEHKCAVPEAILGKQWLYETM
jgi:hypothetical protein